MVQCHTYVYQSIVGAANLIPPENSIKKKYGSDMKLAKVANMKHGKWNDWNAMLMLKCEVLMATFVFATTHRYIVEIISIYFIGL